MWIIFLLLALPTKFKDSSLLLWFDLKAVTYAMLNTFSVSAFCSLICSVVPFVYKTATSTISYHDFTGNIIYVLGPLCIWNL